MKKFHRHSLTVEKFTLLTDHQALHFPFEKKDVHGLLVRWLDMIAEFCYKNTYSTVEANLPADYFPRQSIESEKDSESF